MKRETVYLYSQSEIDSLLESIDKVIKSIGDCKHDKDPVECALCDRWAAFNYANQVKDIINNNSYLNDTPNDSNTSNNT